ncbi:hypothetical protein GCM10009661_75450 [Catellatospora chokoriensis]
MLGELGHHRAFLALFRSTGVRVLYDHRRANGDRYAAALLRVYARLLARLHHCLTHDLPYEEHWAFPAVGTVDADGRPGREPGHVQDLPVPRALAREVTTRPSSRPPVSPSEGPASPLPVRSPDQASRHAYASAGVPAE